MSKNTAKAACRAINRLAVACHDEVVALDWAAPLFGGERGARLRQQSSRRAIFLSDLHAGVVALGGVPVAGPSYGAKLWGVLRSVRELVTGPQQRGAYVTCASVIEQTAQAYERVLALDLPADVRSGVALQHAEIERDRQELRWLRWGGSLSDTPQTGGPPPA